MVQTAGTHGSQRLAARTDHPAFAEASRIAERELIGEAYTALIRWYWLRLPSMGPGEQQRVQDSFSGLRKEYLQFLAGSGQGYVASASEASYEGPYPLPREGVQRSVGGGSVVEAPPAQKRGEWKGEEY